MGIFVVPTETVDEAFDARHEEAEADAEAMAAKIQTVKYLSRNESSWLWRSWWVAKIVTW